MTRYLFILLIFFFFSCGTKEMKTSGKLDEKFQKFKEKKKFEPDNSIMYPGISSPTLTPILTAKINQAADDFKAASLRNSPTEKDYLNAIKTGLERFHEIYIDIDTEDRERVARYFEELMDIVGLESSDGQLNNFVYDFNPGDNQYKAIEDFSKK